jgi:hypothetical protein
MVRFEDYDMAPTKVMSHQLRRKADIGDMPEADTFNLDDESKGIGSIVRYGERSDGEIADDELFPGGDGLCVVQASPLNLFRVDGSLGRIYRLRMIFVEHSQAADVIHVFVTDDNTVEIIRIPVGDGETLNQLPPAESRVDKNRRTGTAQQRGVSPGTTA